MKRFLCVLSSVVIALSCFCFSASAEQKVIGYYPTEAAYNAGALYHSFLPKGYEIGKCVFDLENDIRVKDGILVLDDNGYYRLRESHPNNSGILSGFVKGNSCPFYFVEFDLMNTGLLQIYSNVRDKYSFNPSYASNILYCRFGGPSSAFTSNLGGQYPKVTIGKASTGNYYGIKYLRIYEVNISGTAAIEKTGNAFGFIFNGIKNVIGIVFNYPVLVLGIALFCCGCAVAVYYRLRS